MTESCKTCNTAMLVDPADPRHWVCPKCGRGVHSRQISEFVAVQDGLAAHGLSNDTINGVPVREAIRSVAPNGERGSMDVDRSQEGRNVKLSVRHPQPFRSNKSEEERRAVEAMIARYNEAHGGQFQVIPWASDEEARAEDARGVDVKACDPLSNRVDFQVVKAAEQQVWRDLSSLAATHVDELAEDEFLQRLSQVAEKKKRSADPNVVLVIDGWGVTTPPGTVELFRREYGYRLQEVGYREIWWSDRLVGGTVVRLA